MNAILKGTISRNNRMQYLYIVASTFNVYCIFSEPRLKKKRNPHPKKENWIERRGFVYYWRSIEIGARNPWVKKRPSTFIRSWDSGPQNWIYKKYIFDTLIIHFRNLQREWCAYSIDGVLVYWMKFPGISRSKLYMLFIVIKHQHLRK